MLLLLLLLLLLPLPLPLPPLLLLPLLLLCHELASKAARHLFRNPLETTKHHLISCRKWRKIIHNKKLPGGRNIPSEISFTLESQFDILESQLDFCCFRLCCCCWWLCCCCWWLLGLLFLNGCWLAGSCSCSGCWLLAADYWLPVACLLDAG